MKEKSGFVSIMGRPNVGKSTLLNRIIGLKLAGVSPKPQTTRQTIRGILTEKRGQIVFLDTPGLHQPKDALGNRMATSAAQALLDSDLVLWMVPPEMPGRDHQEVLEMLKKTNKPIALLINKVDRVNKLELLPIMDAYQKLFQFTDIFPIAALRGLQVAEVVSRLFELLPEHPPYFPADQVSDQTERFIVAEMIREKAFRFTQQEIPYSTAVTIEAFEERPNQMIYIEALIYVERDSQKKIIIGKKGDMVKQIGSEARKDIEAFLHKKVFLQLQVKVKEDWKVSDAFLERIEHEGEAA